MGPTVGGPDHPDPGRTHEPPPHSPTGTWGPPPRQTGSENRRHTPTDAPSNPPAESHPHPSNQTKTITCSYTNTHPRTDPADAELPATDRSDPHKQVQLRPLAPRELKGGKGLTALPWPGLDAQKGLPHSPGQGNWDTQENSLSALPTRSHPPGTLPTPPPLTLGPRCQPPCRGHLQSKSRASTWCLQPAPHCTPSVHLRVP